MGLLDASYSTVQARPRKSDRIQQGTPLNMRGLLDAATNIPVVGDALSGGMAVYDAVKGDYPSAAMNALGVLPFVSGTFIGKSAKTWDAVKAAEAEKRLAAGDDVRKVWKETGTFKGPDGHLRQEIDDSKAVFQPSPSFFTDLELGARQGNVLNHPNLYMTGYGLENIPVKRSLEPGGSFWGVKINDELAPHLSEIEIGSHAVKKTPFGFSLNDELAKSANLHELQHAVQDSEGFAKGGNVNDVTAIDFSTENQNKINGMRQLASVLENEGKYSTADGLRKRVNELYPDMKLEAYRRLAGEAEARATQARMNMNMDQRLNTYPLDSYDVPVDQLIIRGGLLSK